MHCCISRCGHSCPVLELVVGSDQCSDAYIGHPDSGQLKLRPLKTRCCKLILCCALHGTASWPYSQVTENICLGCYFTVPMVPDILLQSARDCLNRPDLKPKIGHPPKYSRQNTCTLLHIRAIPLYIVICIQIAEEAAVPNYFKW